MKYEKLINSLFTYIGGVENVKGLSHCATRLRFQVEDVNKADLDKLSKLEGVIDAITGQDEIQIIIGPDVPFVYKEALQITKIDERESKSNEENTESNEGIGSRILGFISGTFSSLLPVFIGCGMVKAIVMILFNFEWFDGASGLAAVLGATGNAVFYFMPVFIGFSAARRLGANPYMGAVFGAILLEPNITNLVSAGTEVDFIGIPMYLIDYSSTIIPVFLAVTVYYFLDKWLNKVIHKNLKTVFIPTITLLIVVPLTLLIFGPFGVYTADLLTDLFMWLNGTSSILLGAVYGAYMVFGVMFGFGWIAVPMMLQNLSATGSDPIQAIGAAYNFAIFGMAFGFFLKSKDESVKSVALSSMFAGLLAGISEPTLYGLILKYNRTLPMLVLAGGLGGALIGLFKVECIAFVFCNIFTIGSFSPFIPYLVIIALSFAFGAAMIMIFGYEKKQPVQTQE